jgi:protein tyrosine/serine phosphatase
MPVFRNDIGTLKGRAHAWSNSMFVDHGVFRLVWHNFATVVPGEFYRANHPNPAALAIMKKRANLRSVINLRGPRDCGSDALSREASDHLGLAHYDAPFESRGAPHRDRILRLAELLPKVQGPILIHCKSGADRTGLVSGLYLLMKGGSSEQALAQLSWKFGHFNRSRTGILDAFFILYAREAEGRMPFLDWVANEYDEMELRRTFSASGLSTFITDKVLRRE